MTISQSRILIAVAALAIIVPLLFLLFSNDESGESDLSGHVISDDSDTSTSHEPARSSTSRLAEQGAAPSNSASPESGKPERNEQAADSPPTFNLVIRGKVIGPQSLPIEGATIGLIPKGSLLRAKPIEGERWEPRKFLPNYLPSGQEVRSKADGSFEFAVSGYQNGEFDQYEDFTYMISLNISAPGYVGVAGHVGVKADGEHSEPLIVLWEAMEIMGRVVERSGEGVADARIGIVERFASYADRPKEPEGASYSFKYRENGKVFTSDADGRFKLTLRKTNKSIWAEAGDPKGLKRSSERASIDADFEGEVELLLPSTGALTFAISNPEVSRVHAMLMNSTHDTLFRRQETEWVEVGEITPDSSGVYRIEGLMATCTRLQLTTEGDYSVLFSPVTCDAGGNCDLGQLTFRTRGGLQLIVHDEVGSPVEGAEVRCEMTQPKRGLAEKTTAEFRGATYTGVIKSLVEPKTTDASGAVTYVTDSGINLSISVLHSDFVPLTVRHTLEDHSKPLTLTLKRSGTLTVSLNAGVQDEYAAGHVYLMTNRHYDAARLSRMDILNLGLVSLVNFPITTSESFKVHSLEPNEWRGVLVIGPSKSIIEPFKIEAGLNTELTLSVPQLGSVSGTITDYDGSPLANTKVWLTTDSYRINNVRSHVGETTTDSVGSYRFDKLSVGAVFLIVQSDAGPDDRRISSVRNLADLARLRTIHIKSGEHCVFNLDLSKRSGTTIEGFIRINGQRGAEFTSISVGGTQARNGRVVNEDGSFRWLEFPEGNHTIYFNETPLQLGRYTSVRLSYSVRTTEEQKAAPVQLELNADSVSGTIKLPAVYSGAKSAISLEANFSDGPLSARVTISAKEDGSFEFHKLLHGTHSIRVIAPGFTQSVQEINVVGPLGNLQLPIGEVGGSVVASIKSLSGSESVGAPQDNYGGFAYLLGDDGKGLDIKSNSSEVVRDFIAVGDTLTIPDVPPGEYTLWSGVSGYARQKVSVVVKSGEVTRVDFDFVRYGYFELTINIPGATSMEDVKDLTLSLKRPSRTEPSVYKGERLTHIGGSQFSWKGGGIGGADAVREAGEHTFEVALDGYETYSITDNYELAMRYPITINLIKK